MVNHERFLTGRTAMVTGGGSGMGRAIALALAKAGANVAIGSLLSNSQDKREEGEVVYMPGIDELEQVKLEIEEQGVECLAMALDVCSNESVLAFATASAEKFGKIDILANAAGITAEQSVVGHPDELWNKVIDVNLNGTYRCVKACLPQMIENSWGRIINIASTAATVGAPTSAAYCSSKAAVAGFSRCVALEGAPHGITCNTISPGWVNTNFGNKWMKGIANAENVNGNKYIEDVKTSNPQSRLIQPEEIGALALYLCRDEALGITMQDLTVSAGSLW
ncbi:MAG: 3-hydroxybutyrate dehydrogenase [Halioglobus sp.]|jgi:3-hydroxybutyrate dehydrogenase